MTEITFTLMGSIPSKKNGKNAFVVNGRARVTPPKGYEKWEKDAVNSLGLQKIILGSKNFPIVQAAVTIEFTLPDLRRRDLTNMAEGILDAMVLAGIFPDDCWRFVPTLTLRAMGCDRKDYRAVVRVQTLTP